MTNCHISAMNTTLSECEAQSCSKAGLVWYNVAEDGVGWSRTVGFGGAVFKADVS